MVTELALAPLENDVATGLGIRQHQPRERVHFDGSCCGGGSFSHLWPRVDVRLPDDVAAELKRNKKESAAFDSLSFTNKKEYLEWIVTAKREETRNERIKGTIERLGKGWKNPANR